MILGVTEGRGVECGNDVYFSFVDGKIVFSIYRDVPGVRMDRREPNVVKSFSVEEWTAINEYLFSLFGDNVNEVEEEEERVKGLPKVISGTGGLPSAKNYPPNQETAKVSGATSEGDKSVSEKD